MPPKKLAKTAQQPQQAQPKQQPSKAKAQGTAKPQQKKPQQPQNQQQINDRDVKANSSVSASMALEAGKKAWELRQAAYGAGNSQAREQLLAEAVNREIEAESFGKAAKYTRTGAFQGLAAGAGLGVQPGAMLGKLTGALVGGVVSTVGAVLGGGFGSAYGAISGPFWDLGQMAGQGVESMIGEWLPNWEATSSQKSALSNLMLGAKKTKKPSQEELEEMQADNGGVEPGSQEYQEWSQNMTSWMPNKPSMPSMPNMPQMPNMPSVSGLGSSLGLGGGSNGQPAAQNQQPQRQQPQRAAKSGLPTTQSTADFDKQKQTQPTKPRATPKPKAASKPASQPSKPKQAQSQPLQQSDANAVKKRPKKLEPKKASASPAAPAKKAPPKLQPRPKAAAASGR